MYKSISFAAFSFLFSFSLLFFAVLTPNAFAIEYSGIGGRPAYPDPGNPRTSDIFIHTVKPGTRIEDGVYVINNSKTDKTLSVYSTDYIPSTGGGFACRQMTEPKKEVGRWIAVSKPKVTVPSIDKTLVPFEINVPLNLEPGEYNGCIVIQEFKDQSDENQGMTLITRTALRVAITIPGNIIRKLSMEGFTSFPGENGNIILQPRVENNGNVSIDTDIEVKTWDIFGNLVKIHKGRYAIIPKNTMEWNFEINRGLFGGIFKSTATVSYDADKKAGIGIYSNKPLTELKSGIIEYYMLPSASGFFIIGLSLFIFLSLLLVFLLVRRKKKWILQKWENYSIKKGDTLQRLAEARNTSWKLIAKINHIPPPYVLKFRKKIRIPPVAGH